MRQGLITGTRRSTRRLTAVVAGALLAVLLLPALAAAAPAPLAFAGSPAITTDRCGTALLSADLDGNGLEDLAMGCPGGGGSGQGSVVVEYRQAGGGYTASQLAGPATAGDKCGTALAAGDFNADLRLDLVVGCPGQSRIDVYDGQAGILPVTPSGSITPSGASPSEGCGTSLAAGVMSPAAGADLAVGCPNWNNTSPATTQSGRIFTFQGTGTSIGLGTSDSTVFDTAGVSGDKCGSSLALANLNNDGYDDLVAGCPGGDLPSPDSGDLLVAMRGAGGAANVTPARHAVLSSGQTSAACGTSLSAGNQTGDALSELVVGCPGAGAAAGLVVVLTSAFAAVDGGTPQGYVPAGSVAGDSCGAAVLTGPTDPAAPTPGFAVGCPGTSSGAGAVFRFVRNAGDTGYVAVGPAGGQTHPAAAANRRCGEALTGHDVDGDARMDLAIGCPSTGTAVAGNAALHLTSTTISVTICPPADRDLGVVAPGSVAVIATACHVTFGTDDLLGASLRIADKFGLANGAMHRTAPSLQTIPNITAGPLGSSGGFGLCLGGLDAGTTSPWAVSGCSPGTPDWHPLAANPDNTSIVGQLSTAGSGGVSVRFGLNAPATLRPGTYQSDVVMTVVAPL